MFPLSVLKILCGGSYCIYVKWRATWLRETRGYPIKIRVKADLAKKNNCECLSFSIASSVQRLRSKISHGNPEVRVPLFTTLTAAEVLCMAEKYQ